MENPNYVVRQWKIILYQREPFGDKKRILTVIGSFIDAFIKIKNEMDSEHYSEVIIEEV